eukprot:GILK01002780.1.p1 GENE.GILK01002780.1~~GILK01002780.1.p1  ORF type:complete len:467 (+),score=81.03 GILK01002780.1:45-1403(+)
MSEQTLLQRDRTQHGAANHGADDSKSWKDVTLFKAPLRTLYVFAIVLRISLVKFYHYLMEHKRLTSAAVRLILLLLALYFTPGFHQEAVQHAEQVMTFALWWIGLGVASSIGLGTGLHTFVLYLGPHIMKVTIAATECNTLPEMLPNRWNFKKFGECPPGSELLPPITFWQILSSVQLEAFLWGLGTALGELPPYFVARAARLSGQKVAEFEELEEIEHSENIGISDRLKKMVYESLQNYGFFAIMVFASVPNPLFDLAGITCGHFLIPFATFFGATFIGKAIVKVHIQMLFVIAVFSKHHVENLTNFVENAAAAVYPGLKGKFTGIIEKQKAALHGSSAAATEGNENWVQWGWNTFVAMMILYFLMSIINSLVQEHLAGEAEKQRQSGSAPTAPPVSLPVSPPNEENVTSMDTAAPSSPKPTRRTRAAKSPIATRKSPRLAARKAVSEDSS